MKTQGKDKDVVFLSGVRTPFGTFGGTLKDWSAIDLAAHAAKAALERSGVAPGDVDHAVFGNALQTSADAIYFARHVALKAGLPIETPALTVNRLCGFSMAETAENLADTYHLSRAEVDEYAERSQRMAKRAWDERVFEEEIVPIPVKNPKTKQLEPFARDEHMRPETTKEGLAKLAPYFKKDGVVTAGNASGICDGAAALVVASEQFAKAKGRSPLGRLAGWAVAGVEPRHMGIGPAPAIRKLVAKTGVKLAAVDLVEVNEAFAPQYVAVEKELGLDRAKVNVHGGAIAIGHPLGASGARITAHLLHALRLRGQRWGIGSACIGGGQGIAVLVEAYPKT